MLLKRSLRIAILAVVALTVVLVAFMLAPGAQLAPIKPRGAGHRM